MYRLLNPLALTDEQTKNALDLLVDYLHGYALALNCNPDRTELTIEMLEKPLSLFCLALTQLKWFVGQFTDLQIYTG